MEKAKFFLGGLLAVALLAGCASKQPYGPSGDGTWSPQQVETVCAELVAKSLDSPGVQRSMQGKKKAQPTVIVGAFANDSSEYLDTSIVSSKVETALINDGRLAFVAGGDIRNELRAERQDQQSNASEASAKALGNEKAADYMLNGSVKSIVKRNGTLVDRTYYVYGQLTDLETNSIIWKGDSEVSTHAEQARTRQ
jgi:uncharacterized protein (TIGR02722 family)